MKQGGYKSVWGCVCRGPLVRVERSAMDKACTEGGALLRCLLLLDRAGPRLPVPVAVAVALRQTPAALLAEGTPALQRCGRRADGRLRYTATHTKSRTRPRSAVSHRGLTVVSGTLNCNQGSFRKGCRSHRRGFRTIRQKDELGRCDFGSTHPFRHNQLSRASRFANLVRACGASRW